MFQAVKSVHQVRNSFSAVDALRFRPACFKKILDVSFKFFGIKIKIYPKIIKSKGDGIKTVSDLNPAKSQKGRKYF